MCAINGITAGREEARVAAMNAATRHRGPDGTAIRIDEGITLGFNRLAVIDLSERAMQPMQDALGRYLLVFNGEIYNYRELRRELTDYPFKSESDSEVILAAYTKWGEKALERFNGMFALALWDTREKRLLLARDTAGIKPLYYFLEGQTLLFSSELKGLLAAGIPRKLDQEAFGHYLRLLYVPAPLSMIAGVRKLLPGHVLSYQDGKISEKTFTSSCSTPSPTSYAEAKRAVRLTVEKAVARQLVSDRPVGLYLSGGIDSSSILAAAAKTHPKINTYAVGFELEPGEEPEKFNADAHLARATAAAFGATHHEFFLTGSEAVELFMGAARALDEPIGNSTALAQLFLAKKVKPTATVVLAGDGGDELFGGYERYRLSLIAEYFGLIFPFGKLGQRGIDRFAQLMFQKDSELAHVLASGTYLPDTKRLFEKEFGRRDIASVLMAADERHWLVDEALARTDRMSMAHSVEVRVPLLDDEVRALAHSLPRSYRITSFVTKRILKDAFRDVLPSAILTAPKRGWFSPGAKWLRRPEFVALAEDLFNSPGEVGELFNIIGMREIWTEHREKRQYHFTILWALITFIAWAREYKITL